VIRLLGNQQEWKRAIENEVRIVTKLSCKRPAHPNIVQVFRHGGMDKSPYYYLDMELCDENLEQYMNRYRCTNTSMGIWQIWNIMAQIADGLSFIHHLGEVHRDMKPNNSNSDISYHGADIF